MHKLAMEVSSLYLKKAEGGMTPDVEKQLKDFEKQYSDYVVDIFVDKMHETYTSVLNSLKNMEYISDKNLYDLRKYLDEYVLVGGKALDAILKDQVGGKPSKSASKEAKSIVSYFKNKRLRNVEPKKFMLGFKGSLFKKELNKIAEVFPVDWEEEFFLEDVIKGFDLNQLAKEYSHSSEAYRKIREVQSNCNIQRLIDLLSMTQRKYAKALLDAASRIR